MKFWRVGLIGVMGWLGAASLAMAGPTSQPATVKFAALFADHMVLQQQMPVPVWGTAKAGEAITVTLAKRSTQGQGLTINQDSDPQTKTTTADAQGKWMVKLDPLKAGGPLEMTAAGSESVTIHDVLVGEVWIGSGQSNMELPIELTANGDKEIAAANDPQLRIMKVSRSVMEAEQHDMKAVSWLPSTPENIGPKAAVGNVRAVPGVSGICYYFGRELRKKLNVPVGVIDSSFGGSPIAMWIPGATLRADPSLKEVVARWDEMIAAHPADEARYNSENAQWVKDIAAAKAAGQPAPTTRPKGMTEYRYAGMYNGMIVPILPVAVRGILWYQGESDARDPETYRSLFPDLIRSWRGVWGRDDLPFIFVQLAGTNSQKDLPTDPFWPRQRESQLVGLKLPHTAMAVAIDIGEPNIHPKDKQDVAHRLALCAEATVYGQDVPYQGPMYSGMSVEGSKIRIHFDHADGLTAAEMPARLGNIPALPAGTLKQFAIAGADQKFVWADATIDGHDVLASSDAVKSPVAVRYAWADNPLCNLTNSAGLPAVPFRTDDWPMVMPATKAGN